jgi:RNA polymerase sigma factor (sigma-70 family)
MFDTYFPVFGLLAPSNILPESKGDGMNDSRESFEAPQPPRTNSGWRRLATTAKSVATSSGLVDSAMAEDVAQEAMLHYLRAPQAPRSPIAWLRVVIRRLISRRFSHARAEQDANLGFLEALRHGRPLDPDDHLALDEICDRVPKRTRRVLELLRDGLSHRDIAERLDCKVHQVGPRIARALSVARRRAERLRRPNERVRVKSAALGTAD